MAAAVYAGEWPCACALTDRLNATLPPEKRRKRPYTWEVKNGCHKPAPRMVGRLDGNPIDRCLAAQVTERQPDAWRILRIHRKWEQGLAPEAGGMLDVAAPLLDSLELLDEYVAESRQADRPKPNDDGSFGKATPQGRQARRPVKSSLPPLRR